MAAGSRQSGLESRSESAVFDPTLTSWMSRGAHPLEADRPQREDLVDESKKAEKDPEGEIRELFRIFDKSHDNTIASSELGKMLGCMGMNVPDVDVAVIMKELDRNGNGKIEYREFKAFIQEEMRRSEESPLEQAKDIHLAFRVFDCNEEGVVDGEELRTALGSLGEPLSDREITDMLQAASLSEDGKIKYEDLVKVWIGEPKE